MYTALHRVIVLTLSVTFCDLCGVPEYCLYILKLSCQVSFYKDSD